VLQDYGLGMVEKKRSSPLLDDWMYLYKKTCNFFIEKGIMSLTNQGALLVSVMLCHEFCAWYAIEGEYNPPQCDVVFLFSLVFMWVGWRSRNVVIGDKKNNIYPVKNLYTRHKNYVLHIKISKNMVA